MSPSDFALLALLGIPIGAYGTLVGAGGGFIAVPMLLLLYGTSAQQAIGTSLAMIFMNAVSGTVSYARAKRIDYDAAWKFALATLPGAAIGAHLSVHFTTHVFDLIFGGLLILLAVTLLIRPARERSHESTSSTEPAKPRRFGTVEHRIVDAQGRTYVYRFNQLAGMLSSVVIGFFSSILGIGGGIIHVPLLVYAFNFPPHLATATSHLILAITALAGVIVHFTLGHVLPYHALALGLGAIAGAQIGARIAGRVKSPVLLRALALALAVAGARLLFREHLIHP